MSRKETPVQKIGHSVSKRFPSLSATKIDTSELVRFILTKRGALKRVGRHKIGDDARDYVNTSDFLRPLSNKALDEISHLGRNDIHRRLREKTYPFSRLDKKAREILLHLPNSWVHGAADWLLNNRRPDAHQ